MISKQTLFTLLLAFSSPLAAADTIAIIGTGDVGSALGKAFAVQGHTIIYGSRDPERRSVEKLVAATGDGTSATTQFAAAARGRCGTIPPAPSRHGVGRSSFDSMAE